MIAIPTPLVKRMPHVRPIVSAMGLAFNIKAIVENATPLGAAKTITAPVLNECTLPELLIGGKCVMLIGGIIATVGTGANPIILGSTISVGRSIIGN